MVKNKGKTKIVSILLFSKVTGPQLTSVTKHFLDPHNPALAPTLAANLYSVDLEAEVTKSAAWKRLLKAKKPGSYGAPHLCFDDVDRFVCLNYNLDASKHALIMPNYIIDQVKSANTKLTLADEADILFQHSMGYYHANDVGVIELPWAELCLPQMKGVADYLEVNFNNEYLKNHVNPKSYLNAQCRGSRNYRKNHQSKHFDCTLFGFERIDFATCITISLNPDAFSSTPAPGLSNLPVKSKKRRTPQSKQEILPATVDEFPKSTSIELTWHNLSKQQRVSVLHKLGVKVGSSLSEVQYREKLLKNHEFTHRYLNSDAGLKGTSFVFTTKDPAKCVDIKTVKQPQPYPLPNKETAAPQTGRPTAMEVLKDAYPSGYTQPSGSGEQPTNADTAVIILPTCTATKPTAIPTKQNLPDIHIEPITQHTEETSQNEKLTSANSKSNHYEDISDDEMGSLESDQEEENDTQPCQYGYDSVSKTETELAPQSWKKTKKRTKKKKKTKQSCQNYKKASETEEESWMEEPSIERENHTRNNNTPPEATIIISNDYRVHLALGKQCYVAGGKCVECKETCEEEILTCFICNLNVHYCCYNSKSLGAQHKMDKMLFDTIKSMKCLSWKCDGCIGIEMENITDTISTAVQTKVSKSLQQTIDGRQNELKSHMDNIVSEKIGSMKKDLLQLFNASTPLPHSTDGSKNPLLLSQILSNNREHSGTGPKHRQLQVTMPKAKYTGPPLATEASHTHNQRGNVDPKLSVVIRNVQSKKFASHDSYLKEEFNKHFDKMKINHCKRTRYGNILIELTTEDDVSTVIDNWKPTYFTNGDSSQVSTEALRMNKSRPKRFEGVITKVIKELENETIEDALTEEGYTEAKANRFQKEGNRLNTVMLTFSNEAELNTAITKGVFIGRMHFRVYRYTPTKRPMQCYRCNKFGHPAKWCRGNRKCVYCSSIDHVGTDCSHRDNYDRHHCSNCQGNHSSRSHTCPAYKEAMTLITQNSHDD